MAKPQRKNYFSINSLIQKGIEDVREYELPSGKILYRPISQLEAEQAQSVLFDSITDPGTREYLFTLAENNELDKANELLDAANEETIEESEKSDDEIVQIPNNVNLGQLYNAMINHAIRVVYLAVSDFTDDFEEKDLIKLDGIRELSELILKVSGQSKDTLEEVENFRK